MWSKLIIRWLAVVLSCLLFGLMLERKSSLEERDFLRQFKLEKVGYTESLIYDAFGNLQNDGVVMAIYYDVDNAKILFRSGIRTLEHTG